MFEVLLSSNITAGLLRLPAEHLAARRQIVCRVRLLVSTEHFLSARSPTGRFLPQAPHETLPPGVCPVVTLRKKVPLQTLKMVFKNPPLMGFLIACMRLLAGFIFRNMPKK